MYHIIANPASQSGRGLRIWQELEPVFQERNIAYKFIPSTRAGQLAEITAEITSSDTTANIIVLGGDGTINEALQGIRDFSKVNIGYIPTGSSNDLARDMKLPKKPKEILEIILSGKVRRKVDLGILKFENYGETISENQKESSQKENNSENHNSDNRYFVVSSGIGFDAAVCQEALSSQIKETLNKLKLGKLTYLSIALKQLITAKPVSCELYLDDKPPIHAKHFLFIASMIHRYEGGGFKFGPNADAGDGLLDLCFVGKLPKPVILFALPTAFFGKHFIFPQIIHYRAAKVEIKTSIPLWVHTDGEVAHKSSHILLSCEKQKVTFLA